MRVLVTGATGFVGAHLVRLCAEHGAETVGCGRRDADRAQPPGELDAYIRADLTDRGRCRELVESARPDRIFHLAAEASVARSWQEPGSTIDANLRASFNLLEAVGAAAPKACIVIACSGDEYGPVPSEDLPITECDPLRPQSPYALSKAAADLTAGFFADARGARVVRARAFNHTGPGQSDAYVVSSFARQIAEAKLSGAKRVELLTGNLDLSRDFTDVRDVVRAYWMAAERADAGAFNVCSGHSVPLSELPPRLAGHAGIEVGTRLDPERLREGEVTDSYGSHERLTAATGWKPEIRLDETLRDMLEWWERQLEADDDG